MLTVMTVLRSGSYYTAEWVLKLKRSVARNLSVEHRFVVLTDMPVPGVICYGLEHDWPGWWAKIEIFRPGVVQGPTLYLDLDTVLVGSIDALADLPHEFAMMRNVWQAQMPGSAVMWFRKAPHEVYELFCGQADYVMDEYRAKNGTPYMGDQAFIWDALDRKVTYIDECPGLIRSYRRHCQQGVPEGCSLVAFGGAMKPSNVDAQWVKEAWV